MCVFFFSVNSGKIHHQTMCDYLNEVGRIMANLTLVMMLKRTVKGKVQNPSVTSQHSPTQMTSSHLSAHPSTLILIND